MPGLGLKPTLDVRDIARDQNCSTTRTNRETTLGRRSNPFPSPRFDLALRVRSPSEHLVCRVLVLTVHDARPWQVCGADWRQKGALTEVRILLRKTAPKSTRNGVINRIFSFTIRRWAILVLRVLVCRLWEGTNNPCGARAAVAPSLQKAPSGGVGTSLYFFRLPCWLAGHRPFAFRVRFVASHSTHHLPRTCVAPPVPWDVLAPWPCCLLAFRFGSPLCPGTCSPRGRVGKCPALLPASLLP